MITITQEEIDRHRPDFLLPPAEEFANDYLSNAERGRALAAQSSVALVAICRNAMPWLPSTLELVERTGERFASWVGYIYENDSSDDTKEVLLSWADGKQKCVSVQDNGRPHLNNTTAPVRTHALAEYRSACQEFVRLLNPTPDYVIVYDTDPWGGWSIDGIMTSLAHLEADKSFYGMAAYSWCEFGNKIAAHYDAFAARINHWKQRDQNWFHLWHPPVGSPPVEFRSAFGQLAIYRSGAFLSGQYTGEDCEHVTFHRSIRSGRLGLNPSMRVCSFWVPDAAQ
jgi:hypothetical protein